MGPFIGECSRVRRHGAPSPACFQTCRATAGSSGALSSDAPCSPRPAPLSSHRPAATPAEPAAVRARRAAASQGRLEPADPPTRRSRNAHRHGLRSRPAQCAASSSSAAWSAFQPIHSPIAITDAGQRRRAGSPSDQGSRSCQKCGGQGSALTSALAVSRRAARPGDPAPQPEPRRHGDASRPAVASASPRSRLAPRAARPADARRAPEQAIAARCRHARGDDSR